MSQPAGDAAGVRHVAGRLGLREGQVVQELGYDEDCDEELRQSVKALTGSDLVDEDFDDVVDAVLLWWRDDDGDLVDGLLSALPDLNQFGYIWLMTPKVGRSGYVDAADLAEAAVAAGLSLTTSTPVSSDWSATKMVRPRGTRR